jgi:hypothetical protein
VRLKRKRILRHVWTRKKEPESPAPSDAQIDLTVRGPISKRTVMEKKQMNIQLDENLLRQARRSPRHDTLSENERIALNLFWRKGVRVPVLAKVFQCSKNTIYYNCLTGDAASYPAANRAREINKAIDKIGEKEAWSRYVTDGMVRAVNAANKELVERKNLPRSARAA